MRPRMLAGALAIWLVAGLAFVLAPVGLEPPGDVVGAEGVHRVFRRRLTALGHIGYAAP